MVPNIKPIVSIAYIRRKTAKRLQGSFLTAILHKLLTVRHIHEMVQP